MKKLLFILLIIPVFVLAQTMEELDFVSSFSDGAAAVKKGNQWGFINEKGDIIIDFRGDLVLTGSDDGMYPVFKNNRCLISKNINDIMYYGYIDKSGETVIEPIFLNALNFENNKAIALKLTKENVGKNEVLGKNIIYHRYYEVVIDTDGNIIGYLNPKGVNIVLDKKFIKAPPKITSNKISDNIYKVLGDNKKWTIEIIN